MSAAIAEPVSVVEYGSRRWLIVIGVMMAALLQTLDATIVNVALPTIEGNIGAGIDDGTWIITGYIISNVVAIPLAPYMLARFGRRQYFGACVVGFTVGSVLCGTATSLGALIAFRVVQGAFGGGLIATSQIILRDTFGAKQVGTSAGLFAIALTFGPALGPTIGGILTDAFSWQWVFDVNVVPGIIAAVIIYTMLRNPTVPRKMPFDSVGVALLVVTLGSFQYILDEGERHDWFDDPTLVAFAIACVIGLAGFLWWELYGAKSPIIDLRVFRYRNVRFGIPTAIVMGMVVFGPIILMPQYVQNVLGFTATMSGLMILMRALPVVILMPIVARIATRVDARLLLTAGFVLSALGAAAIALHMTPGSDFGSFVVPMMVSGVGQSLLLVPLLIAMVSSVSPADAPKTSSFVSLSVQLGGSISSALLIAFFDQRTFFHADVYRASIGLANPVVRRMMSSIPHAPAMIAQLLARQSANAGFADAVILLAPLALISLVPVWLLLIRRAPARPAPTAAGK